MLTVPLAIIRLYGCANRFSNPFDMIYIHIVYIVHHVIEYFLVTFFEDTQIRHWIVRLALDHVIEVHQLNHIGAIHVNVGQRNGDLVPIIVIKKGDNLIHDLKGPHGNH